MAGKPNSATFVYRNTEDILIKKMELYGDFYDNRMECLNQCEQNMKSSDSRGMLVCQWYTVVRDKVDIYAKS